MSALAKYFHAVGKQVSGYDKVASAITEGLRNIGIVTHYEDSLDLIPENFKREILEVCCTKKYLNYCELSHQVKNDVLKGNTYNGNILGRYFARDMQNCK